MKYLAPARRIACVVIVILGAFGARSISADEARVTAVTAVKANAALAYQNLVIAIEPIVVASSEFSPAALFSEFIPAPTASVNSFTAEETVAIAPVRSLIAPKRPIVVSLADPISPATAREPHAPVAQPPTSPQWPAPARFFTINQVLAKQKQAHSNSPATHLAAIDLKTRSDASPAPNQPTRSDEPFGLFTFRAPNGLLWAKWNNVEADIQAEAPALARCRAEPDHCTPAAARFVAIIKQAEVLQGRAKLEVINARINAAIRYTTDMAHWGVADRWSAPLDTSNKGSFNTGFGDCEDYAIAKYVALRETGVPAGDLRLLLVRDNMVRLDHAVLAAHTDGRWLILDNRWAKLVEDTEARQFLPLFAVNEQGVKLFAAPYAAKQPVSRNIANVDEKLFLAGADASLNHTNADSSFPSS